MNINITPTANTSRLLKKVSDPNIVTKAKRAGMIKATNLFRARAVEKAPIDKGTLRKSILTDVSRDGEEGKIYSKLDYARYQEEGTGIYGPKRRAITPKRARYMRFKSKTGAIVYTKKVKGVRPKRFFKQASEYIVKQGRIVSQVIGDVLKKELL